MDNLFLAEVIRLYHAAQAEFSSRYQGQGAEYARGQVDAYLSVLSLLNIKPDMDPQAHSPHTENSSPELS